MTSSIALNSVAALGAVGQGGEGAGGKLHEIVQLLPLERFAGREVEREEVQSAREPRFAVREGGGLRKTGLLRLRVSAHALERGEKSAVAGLGVPLGGDGSGVVTAALRQPAGKFAQVVAVGAQRRGEERREAFALPDRPEKDGRQPRQGATGSRRVRRLSRCSGPRGAAAP